MANHTMVITITAKVPIPKHRGVALELGIAVADTIQACEDILRKAGNSRGLDLGEGTASTRITYLADDEPAAPKPERKKRRTRAELEAARATEVREPPGVANGAAPARPSLQASGEPGDLDIPAHLDRRA